jgi:hypothetical protein
MTRGAAAASHRAAAASLHTVAAWSGFAAFALSWFLPAVVDEYEITPGWMACWWAIGGPGSQGGFFLRSWPIVLSATSALTNVVMLLALAAIVRGMRPGSWWPWRMAALGVLNAGWVVLFWIHEGSLGIGYFFWWLSFFLVGYGCSRPRHHHRGAVLVAR